MCRRAPIEQCLCVCSAIGDARGEAKASGNIGNVLKNLNRFEEAAVCCERQRSICSEIDGEKVGVCAHAVSG